MPTRYQQLRGAIANLAASADEQVSYLDSLHSPLADGASAADYGNDELALEFGDIYCAVAHMREYDEITQEEIDAAMPLDALLDRWSGAANADFWTREALFSDPRWQEVRQCARTVLQVYPEEVRESGWRPDQAD